MHLTTASCLWLLSLNLAKALPSSQGAVSVKLPTTISTDSSLVAVQLAKDDEPSADAPSLLGESGIFEAKERISGSPAPSVVKATSSPVASSSTSSSEASAPSVFLAGKGAERAFAGVGGDAFGGFFGPLLLSKGQGTSEIAPEVSTAAESSPAADETAAATALGSSSEGVNAQGAGAAIVTSSITRQDRDKQKASLDSSKTDDTTSSQQAGSVAAGRSNEQGAGAAIITTARSQAPSTSAPEAPTGSPATVTSPNPPLSESAQAGTAVEVSSSSTTSSADSSKAPAGTAEAAQASNTVFQLPGRQLAVLPIGLGIFAGVSVIALVIVGVVTYERRKYRKQYRARKMREQISVAGGFREMSSARV